VSQPAPAPAPLQDLRLCLLGFGSVARELCRLLDAQEAALRQAGLRVLVTAVGTRKGSLLVPDAMTPAAVLASVGDGPAPPQAVRPARELLAASGADVLVELTVLEQDYAPLATAHIEAAFALGMDVVTANKGPIAWNWGRIAELARTHGRRIRFESTVMDGLPVFSLLEFTLPHCRLLGFEAVFNSTTNAIIEAMSLGGDFDEALTAAQRAGIAEADPANDVDGWDAACKAAALANVAMDADLTPADIEKQSLRDVPPQLIVEARAAGRRLRLVTQVWREPGRSGLVRGRVQARELPADHPLAPIGGESLGVLLHTDLMGDLLVAELGAMVPQTAYGVYADLLHLWRSR
jgi:homoserine dehydrogenase